MALNDVLDRISGKKEPEDHDAFEEYDYEYEDALDPDPSPDDYDAPVEKPKFLENVKVKPSVPAKLSAKQKKELIASIELMITIPGFTLSMVDPVCGGAAMNNAANIAETLVPIIARNPRLLDWFIQGSGMMDYMALGQALIPVGVTVFQHHVSKSVGHSHEEEHDDLSTYAAPRLQ